MPILTKTGKVLSTYFYGLQLLGVINAITNTRVFLLLLTSSLHSILFTL